MTDFLSVYCAPGDVNRTVNAKLDRLKATWDINIVSVDVSLVQYKDGTTKALVVILYEKDNNRRLI